MMLAVEIALAAAGVGIYVGPLHGLVLAMLGLRRTGVLGVPLLLGAVVTARNTGWCWTVTEQQTNKCSKPDRRALDDHQNLCARW